MGDKISYPTVSVFSGALGLDIGLDQAGFSPRVFVEIDRTCQETIQLNHRRIGWERPSDVPILGDITALSADEILERAGLERGEVALLAGGPPCQAFSTAGKRGSLSDPRGRLLTKYLEIISEIRPRFFVFENVRGILSAAIRHRPLNQRGCGHPPLEDDEQLGSLLRRVVLPGFEEIGYEVLFGLVDAADYGVPQHRERVIFLGSRDQEFSRGGFQNLKHVMPPTHSGEPSSGLLPWKTLGQALEGLNEPVPEYIPYSKTRAEVYALVPPGQNWRYLRDTMGVDFLKKVMGGAFHSGGGKVGYWRRLSFDKPCATITTSPVQKATGLCHPLETRPLSVRECARVQTFPDDWIFAGSVAKRYTQIGNAVPVELGRAIGEGLVKVARARESRRNALVQGRLIAG